MTKRLIAYPDGMPSGDHRGWCDELTHPLGGDVTRVFDSPTGSLITFIKQASRARAFRDPHNHALVVLSRTNPLALTLPARHRLEQEFPIFRHAVWALYWDPERSPDLVSEARELGSLSGNMESGPIWTASRGERLLILSPSINNPKALAERARSCLRQTGDQLTAAYRYPVDPIIVERSA
jgi:hypothetical protein